MVLDILTMFVLQVGKILIRLQNWPIFGKVTLFPLFPFLQKFYPKIKFTIFVIYLFHF